MKKLVIVMILILVFALSMVYGESTGTLAEIVKPDGMQISGNKLFIIQGTAFHVFNLIDLKPLATFGKSGVGPGELRPPRITPNRLTILNDTLVAEDTSKLIFFTKDFAYSKEIKKKDMMTHRILPAGNHFVAFRMSSNKNLIIYSVILMDADFNLIKELARQETFDRQKELILLRDAIHFCVYKDKIYIEKSDKSFLIEVFDFGGNSLLQIRKSSDPPPVTAAVKKACMEDLKLDRVINSLAQREGGWDSFLKKGTFTFPPRFPHIKDLVVSDDKIYVSTFDRKDQKEKIIVMDLKGEILAAAYMPIPISSPYLARTMGRENRFYAIKDNKYYYLVLNEDEDNYELHVNSF